MTAATWRVFLAGSLDEPKRSRASLLKEKLCISCTEIVPSHILRSVIPRMQITPLYQSVPSVILIRNIRVHILVLNMDLDRLSAHSRWIRVI